MQVSDCFIIYRPVNPGVQFWNGDGWTADRDEAEVHSERDSRRICRELNRDFPNRDPARLVGIRARICYPIRHEND